MPTSKAKRSTTKKGDKTRRGNIRSVSTDDEAQAEVRQVSSFTRYTEVHASERLAEFLHDRYCFSPGLGWMRYTGKVWVEVAEDAVVEIARQQHKKWYSPVLVQAIMTGEKSVAATKRLLSAAGVKAIVGLCRGQMLVDTDEFDAEADLLNTPSGVVDLKTGRLSAHDPGYYMTRMTSVPYVKGAKHPDWEAVLKSVRSDARAWLQVRLGNAITGHQPDDDAVPFLQGSGANGKSTLLLGFTSALGNYHMQVSDKILTADAKAHTTEMTDLRGLRCATVEELPEGGHLNTVFIKKITGQWITARRMYRDTITFKTTHSLFVTTNFTPVVSETDWGTWRRLPRLVFPYKFVRPGTKKKGPNDRPGDPKLRERVESDPEVAQAALAFAVEGAVRWYKSGRVMPEMPASVRRDTDNWRAESDLVFRYWSECLVADSSAHVLSGDLSEHFNSWLKENGHQAWSSKTITARLGDHDATQQAKVEKPKPMKAKPGLSRPASVAGAGGDGERVKPKRTYRAWIGLRFADEA